MTAALVIFVVTYLAIAGQRLPFVLVDRPAAALCGAVAMVAFGVLPLDDAYRAVNLDTVVLLLGMMVIAAYLTEAAFFRTTAWFVLGHVRSARTMLWAIVFVAGGLSALLVNDTVCLMFTPLVMAVVLEARLPPLPYLLALALGSNVGSAVTFTGNPQNMLVGMAARGNPSYLEYAALAIPAGVAALAATALTLSLLFRTQLPAGKLPEMHVARPPLNPVLAGKGIAALILFVVLAALGKSLAGSAITAAAFLILIARVPPRPALARVDWVLLLFFSGLFVVVHGLAHSGALDRALEVLGPVLDGDGLRPLLLLAILTMLGSNLVSNVPFVLVAARWVPEMSDPRWGWITLAFASTLAGNLTLFGSMANIIVFEGAGPEGRVGFLKFFRYGLIVTVVTSIVAGGVLAAEHALGW